MKDLLIPRVIVTNPYPNMPFKVGDILLARPYNDKPNDNYEKSGNFVSVESAHECTANFRPSHGTNTARKVKCLSM